MKTILPLTLLLASGCALLSKSTAVDIRYFSPESLEPPAAPRQHSRDEPLLRIGRISSSANLRYRIVRRESDVEVGQYETLRWTENPEAYVRRLLVHALFEDHPLQQAVAGPVPVLDVEVVAFEEVRYGARPSGRVQIRYQLQDDRSVLATGIVTVQRDSQGDGVQPVVIAIGQAMIGATTELAAGVAARLSQ